MKLGGEIGLAASPCGGRQDLDLLRPTGNPGAVDLRAGDLLRRAVRLGLQHDQEDDDGYRGHEKASEGEAPPVSLRSC